MQLKNFDHIVITTDNIEKMLDFYVRVLGMQLIENNGRYAVSFGKCKINFHTVKGQFQPAAANPTYGSQDICLVAAGKIEDIAREIVACGWNLETDIVDRNGACGKMRSIYVRDPDGNLVEICCY